jgi:hypothetical protein
MRLIIVLWALFSTVALAEKVPANDELTPPDYEAAERYGYKNQNELRQLHKKLRRSTKTNEIISAIENDLASDNRLLLGEKLDDTFKHVFNRVNVVLRAEGHGELADEIAHEFTFYSDHYKRQALGMTDIGDHPPMSEWLVKVHDKIELALGEFWCKFWHFHDIKILNYGIPVVFHPAEYDLADYKDHFAGSLIAGFWWDYHGVAGVITYWAVNLTCSFGTSGIATSLFVCGPIASFAEHVMDKRLAPGFATRIWNKYN